MTEPQHILVVDDDSDVRWMVRKYLSKHGFNVDAADGGAQMRQQFDKQEYDIVILDITMPGEDGLTLARYLRENYSVGIIMLTASAEVVDRVIGLEMGADDYMTKPFEPRELLARVKSVARRLGGLSVAKSGNTDDRVQFGQCSLDIEAHRLYDTDGHEVAITNMEYDLLKAFAENPDKVLNRDKLLNLAHNREWDPYDRSIDIRIARLRRKIEPDPAKPRVIKTIRGAGYMFVSSE